MISATKWMYLKITILKKDDRHIKECNVYFHLFEYLGKLKLNISNKEQWLSHYRCIAWKVNGDNY